MASAVASADIPPHQTPSTSLSPTTDYSDPTSFHVSNITEYQSLVGQLIFVTNTDHPDVALAVCHVARLLKDPCVIHLAALNVSRTICTLSDSTGLRIPTNPRLHSLCLLICLMVLCWKLYCTDILSYSLTN